MSRRRLFTLHRFTQALGRCLRPSGIQLSLCMLVTAACQEPSPAAQPGFPQDVVAAIAGLPAPESVEVILTATSGLPEFVRGSLGTLAGDPRELSVSTAQAALQPALAKIAPLFRLQASELRPWLVQRSADQRTHVRLQQTKYGLVVVGGDLIVHIEPSGQIYAVNGTAQGAPAASPPASASTSPLAAGPKWVYWRDARAGLHLAEERVQEGMRDGTPFRDLVYISVDTGQQLAALPQVYTTLPTMQRELFSADHAEVIPGRHVRHEGDAPSGDADLDTNYDRLAQTYNCYDALLGRASYDDAGGPLQATVHFGMAYNNAFSSGDNLAFGDGDGLVFSPLGSDQDVVSHELTHTTTAHTARLQYQGESGALNESMSDVSAAACDSWMRGKVLDDAVWKIGEAAYTPGTAGDALRYMDNPTRDHASRDYYPERYSGTDDSGGVHWNSGIPNLAFKLLAAGGKHPRSKTTTGVNGVGIYKASQIWFTALFFYMSDRTDMHQARAYTVQAAADSLYPANVIDSVSSAWEAVGVK